MKYQAISLLLGVFLSLKGNTQNPAIKCYFNNPVNNSISTGQNATYLNKTFPDTIAAYINRAKFTIDICMYNYTATAGSSVAKIAVAANAAAARGIVIRWIYNGTTATNNSGLLLLSNNIKTLASPNLNNYIMHNKFMVIDVNAPDTADAIAQTGSYNFSDQQTNTDYNNIVFIQSKQVALAFYDEFNKMWGGISAIPNATLSNFSTSKTASSKTKFNINGTDVEVYFSPKDSTGDRLMDCINTANEDLFFGVYTFTNNTIANLIKDKFNNGLFVRGIIDKFSLSFNAYSILNPVLESNMITHNGANLYHNKIMLVDANTTTSDPQVFTGSFNWTTQAQAANDENAIVIHDAAIANQYYQSLCKDYTDHGGTPCLSAPCQGANNILFSTLRGSTYQWQLNTGSGFSAINPNAFYNRTDTNHLVISNAPSAWYGYQYRCLVDGASFSDTTTLKFTAYWNGNSNSQWENTANWNCGVLPDANTDVIINSGVQFYPMVNATTSCRSLHISKNGAATLALGIHLLLTGR